MRGEPCGRPPIRGGFVCPKHGGAAPQVRAKANERLADLIDPDRALREAARLAYSDLRLLFDEKGQLIPVKDWPADLAGAIGGFEVVKRNVDSADGKTDDVIKVKLWDKPKSLDMLFRHLALYKDELSVKMPQAEAILTALEEGRRRVAERKTNGKPSH